MNKEDVGTLFQIEGVEPIVIRCAGCGSLRGINIKPTSDEMIGFSRHENSDVVLGSHHCPKCETWTSFEIIGGHLRWCESGNEYGSLDPDVPSDIAAVFREAPAAFSSHAYRAAAVICRATVETMLEEKGFKRGKLVSRINAAKRKGAFTDTEVMSVHGSRLIGNRAIHIRHLLYTEDIPLLMSATVQIVNKLATYAP